MYQTFESLLKTRKNQKICLFFIEKNEPILMSVFMLHYLEIYEQLHWKQ